ncbi:single-stranded DNA-binding protein, mitochondrial [Bactrocera oleae]|uniref:single-stranded DNA-binding protein, mitochondrial n=1 Tax=Bactrocera oleae TaxID=104688 RepID=UPI0006B7EEBD|nr:single-stranded DNA-binding protein, mitochondrial [Bactrocera oleae]XP_036228970.1 single-stranded DNA-binding protein, mitochondrial [Bactrocera oleae]
MISQSARTLLSPLRMALRQVARCSSNEAAPARVEKTVNNVTILGRVGADPQLRGSVEHPVVMFSVATHTNYRYESGDWAQRTDWHRVIVFKPNLRETVMEHLKKGQRTMVQGKITYGEIIDQQGNQKTTTSIIADDVIFFRTDS